MPTLSLRTFFIVVCVVAAIFFMVKTNGKEGFKKMTGKPSCPNILVQKGNKIYLYNNRLAEVPGVNPIVFNNLEEYTEFIDWQRSQGIRCPVLYLQEVIDASGKRVCKVRPCTLEPQGGLPPSNSTIEGQGTCFSKIPQIEGVNGVSGGCGSIDNPYSQASKELNENALDSAAPYASRSSSAYAINPNDRYSNLERTKLIDAVVNDPPYNIGGYPSYDDTSFYHGKHTPLDQMDVINEAKPASANAMDPNWGGKTYTQELLDNDYYRANEVHFYP